MWQDILASILTSGSITGIFILIINKAIENKFDMKLEAYKDKLKYESDTELLNLKSKLEMTAKEREIKFGGVFPSQREVIENTYAKIVILAETLESFGIGLFGSSVAEKSKLLHDVFNEFCLYYYPKAIYLPERTAKSVGSLVFACDVLARHYRAIDEAHLSVGANPYSDHNQTTYNELLAKCPELEKSFGDFHIAVIHEFQRVLGVRGEDSQTK